MHRHPQDKYCVEGVALFLQTEIFLNYNKPLLAIIAITAALTSGCAAYRTEANAPLPTAATSTANTKTIVISEGALPDKKYKTLGPIADEVKKLTVFHTDPTKDQVNLILIEKARAMEADAVINVIYKSGIGLMTWGYIEATGTGVKFVE